MSKYKPDNKNVRKCIAKNCTKTCADSVTLFRLPKEPERCIIWLKNSDRLDLAKYSCAHLYGNYRICSSHFENKMFAGIFGSTDKTRLKANAVPTIFSSEAMDNEDPPEISKSGEVVQGEDKNVSIPLSLKETNNIPLTAPSAASQSSESKVKVDLTIPGPSAEKERCEVAQSIKKDSSDLEMTASQQKPSTQSNESNMSKDILFLIPVLNHSGELKDVTNKTTPGSSKLPNSSVTIPLPLTLLNQSGHSQTTNPITNSPESKMIYVNLPSAPDKVNMGPSFIIRHPSGNLNDLQKGLNCKTNTGQVNSLFNLVNIDETQKIEENKCRSCLITTNQNTSKSVTQNILSYKTVKEMIVLLVPEVGSKLKNSNVICIICYKMLEATVKFIKKCQEAEATLLSQPKTVYQLSDSEDEPLACNDQEYEEESFVPHSPEYVSVDEIGSTKDENESKIELIHLPSDGENNHENENEEGPTEEIKLVLPTKITYKKGEKRKKKSKDEQEKSKKRGKYKKREVNIEKKISCPTCSESFTKAEYETHMDVHPPFICELCGKGFKKRDSIRAHRATHNDPNSFICEVCGKPFKAYDALRYHLKSHTSNEWFKCHICSKQYRKKRHLVVHIKHVHEKVCQVQCTQCGKLFRNQSIAQTHARIVHNKEKPYECKICHRKFGRSDYLHNHLVRHRDGPSLARRYWGEKGGPLTCRFCEKLFDDMKTLKTHLKTHAKRFACQFCNLTFAVKQTLKRHEKLHEGGNVNFFRCNTCWKRFKTKDALEEHSLRHKNLKYACTLCDKSFSKEFILKHHNSVVHSDVLISGQQKTNVSKNLESSVDENLAQLLK